MAPPPGPYSGTSTLALVARASAFTLGVVYGSVKLKILKVISPSNAVYYFLNSPSNFSKYFVPFCCWLFFF
ncbi:uncharacterized protein LOC132190266 [Corylus avellana]|uniref:uncharacterized protein LOC132190266 n=1 Tax=Corylus avellana TaxID=13451 RepID=UPI00286B2FF0|nr:uncharacterized protein LOC132190266 [Corylus avellana]